MKISLPVAALLAVAPAVSAQKEKLEFTNVGYKDHFKPVRNLKNIDDADKCKCDRKGKHKFKGDNAPLSEYLSVHFRGPLSLKQFAFYTTDGFTVGGSNTSAGAGWNRGAYYDASAQTASNITFLNLLGENSPCAGPALSWAGADGTSLGSSATTLKSDNYLKSGQELILYSTTQCPKSKHNKGCGVYRKDIPAFYGYYGHTKMFLFEFTMPTENSTASSSNANLPGIWLMNDRIARTGEYAKDEKCNCLTAGCGAYDVFKATDASNPNRLFSNMHTLQGNSDAVTGIASTGYIQRKTNGTMKGGVVFDDSGNVVTFISDATTFDAQVADGTVQRWLNGITSDDTASTALQTVGKGNGDDDKDKDSSSNEKSTDMNGSASDIYENSGFKMSTGSVYGLTIALGACMMHFLL